MNELIQTNVPGLCRDTRSGAIINRNISEMNQHMLERNRLLENEKTNKRIDDLSNDVNEIKNLLKLLVANKDVNSNS